jgi:hypothetical protein
MSTNKSKSTANSTNNKSGGTPQQTTSKITAVNTIQSTLSAIGKTQEINHRNAFRSLAVAMTGKEVTLDLVDGTVVTGILHAAVLYKSVSKKQIVLKAVKVQHVGLFCCVIWLIYLFL